MRANEFKYNHVSVIALVVLGKILCGKGDFNGAVEHLHSAVSRLRETEPNSTSTAESTNPLHRCCCLHFCMSLTLSSPHPTGLYLLGIIAKERGQWSVAQQYITEFLRVLHSIYPNGHSKIVFGNDELLLKVYLYSNSLSGWYYAAEKLLQQIVEIQRSIGCSSRDDDWDREAQSTSHPTIAVWGLTQESTGFAIIS